jgi:hypothetical protein
MFDQVTADSRGEIEEEYLELLEVDYTTRAEVVLILGEPEYAAGGDKFFIYSWEREYGAFILCAQGCIGFPVTKEFFLLIEFDEEGYMMRYEIGKGSAAWQEILRHVSGSTDMEPG